MGPKSPSHLVVGHLNKVHGMKGELFLWPLTVAPESAFNIGGELRIADQTDREPDPSLPVFRIEGVRPFKRGFLLKLEGLDSRAEAELIAGRYVLKPMEQITALAEDEVFYHDLLGMRVQASDGTSIGEIVEVYELEPAHMLEVSRASGTILIPFTQAIVRSVDREEKCIVIDPPEGLLAL